uniref:BPTI/Kunitz inhibitor domain-containing protein n=1 Tax=Amblyomma cajennense TaxID=34607 RepID=A0A023FU35_AMBCJ
MILYSELSFFLFLGLCTAASRSTKDPRCISDQTIITTRGCRTIRWQFNPFNKTCIETCNKDGPFDSKLACDGYCRSVDVCRAPRAVSSCGGDVHPVYYYNPTTRQCHEDIGCIYSGNNFPTITECQETCMRRRPTPPNPQRCFVVPSQGYPCQQSYGSQRFYYNYYTGHCMPFWYHGCGGSANRFRSYRGCMNLCRRH